MRSAMHLPAQAAGLAARLLGVGLAVLIAVGASSAARGADDRFHQFIEDLWPKAQARDVSRATFDAAFKGVTLDPRIVKLPDQQAEFVRPIWDYLAANIDAKRIRDGQAKARQWSQVLGRAEAQYGVDRNVVLAIWAMESGYGAFTGVESVVRVLATLAYIKYQGDYARDELLDALDILQAGDVTPAAMRGSWAGAMGQTQFMPSSFKAYAVDFDGDGRRNIWTSVPDALASTANFLKGQGWSAGETWGFEVKLPKGFDASHNEESTFAPFAAWAKRGITRVGGGALPSSGEATLLVPAGLRGPGFLVTRNFKVIKAYNNSTSYALCVALLSDRIAGRGPLAGAWPVKERMLTISQAKALQARLRDLGYDVGAIDGKIGEKARDAIFAFQAKAGLVADGFPTLDLLEKVRAAH
jgi:membrane-bound lytic murein transglycosylase B